MVAVLYEREEAVEAIGRVVSRAGDGRGGAVLLVGEPGTGKTTLLDTAAMVGSGASAATALLRAKGAFAETDLAFAFVEQLHGAPPVAAAGHLLPSTPPSTTPAPGTPPGTGGRPAVPAPARRFAEREALVAHLAERARSGLVLVLLDDLHWADPDSLEVVGYVARRLAAMPVGLVAALRPWPPGARSLAESLVVEGHATVVEIGALSRPATAALLQELAPGEGASEDLAERGWRLTKGNPMLVHQAARVLPSSWALPEASGADLPRLQRILLLSHLAPLPPEALECARVAAVLGTRCRVAVAEQLSCMSPVAFAEAFDALVLAGVLDDAEAGYAEFRHDLLASAIYEDMGPARRRSLHRAAYGFYVGHAELAAAATHALRADLQGEQVVTVLTDAGTQALAQGAAHTAVGLLRAAAHLGCPALAHDLAVRLGDGLFAADQPDQALAVYKRLLSRELDPLTRTDTLAKAARALAYAGQLDEAERVFEDAFRASRALTPAELGPTLAGLLAQRAHLAWERDGPAAALAKLAPDPGGHWPSPEPDVLRALRGFFLLRTGDRSGVGDVEAAAKLARRRISADDGDLVASFNILLLHPATCMVTERYDEAAELLSYARQRFREVGSLRSTVALATSSVLYSLSRGDLPGALAEADRFAEDLAQDMLGRPRLSVLKAHALTALGRVGESRECCDALEAEGAVGSQFTAAALGMARAQHLVAAGSFDEAASAYMALGTTIRLVGIGSMLAPSWAGGALDAAAAAGRTDDVAEVVAWLEDANASLGCSWPRMLALAGRASIAAQHGDDLGAEAAYEEALAAPQAPVLERAAIMCRYGAWLRRAGKLDRARSVLGDSLRLCEARGAALLAARAHCELGAAGGRRRPAERAPGLSTQELRVARLASSGATTAEIASGLHLSPRTVETHLAHAFAKLGVRSRRELRQRSAELDT